MKQLIPTHSNENGNLLVSGRDLHEFLEIGTEYRKWFGRMVEYGFAENVDFVRVTQKCPTPGGMQEIVDHHVKIEMAKEISMIQRNDKGKQARQYFLDLERKWNSPEMVIKRAHEYLQQKVAALTTDKLVLTQQVNELQPKASYYDMVLQNKSLLSVTNIAKDYGMSAKTLNKKLHELGVQFKQGDVWLLYAKYQDKGYTQTSTHVIDADKSRVTTKWTQKGRLFIYDLLKQQGILPVIERESDAS
ncbi:phage antirepressor KilAC domain-containing protein [Paenibacillus larvae]|uniref:Putative antirepressor, phage associated n=1 Tax=Paenibacillus larvae subsp. larvae TaxID=147375 RepID=A0A2L1U477_9BACL|nr:phage antirepressor KilAC domain-containing protein [Paenibacillus larvae]AQZ46073.1 phage antirepressor Ant [Paenibacillus larvae subsp. pulvifaciens]AVF27722.1 putative antirepressor, phage associated [Paenibacillus larvae subsp. larvae]MBH0344122.1 antirepressor [Paenibacillus larvae]MCY7522101.1 phage antirepressor KilAC domain-containing protein [Paenibacillus larvae]MCY9500867.1 phage antirepressor KilAC domain-containing protein [Paenibacillus larvae]